MTEDSKNALFLIAVKFTYVSERESVKDADFFFNDNNSKAQCWFLVSIQIPMLSDALSLLHQET